MRLGDEVLGNGSIDTCDNADRNGNFALEINELVSAVNSALNGCPDLPPTPTAPGETETPVANTATPTPTTPTGGSPSPTPTQTSDVTPVPGVPGTAGPGGPGGVAGSQAAGASGTVHQRRKNCASGPIASA